MEESRRNQCPESLDDPRLLPFLPMIYVAWADGDLSLEEIGAIRARLRAQADLPVGCRQVVAEWLDPENPPRPRDFNELLQRIRSAAVALSTDQRISLTGLGQALARAGHHGEGLDAAEEKALRDLEGVLGVPGDEAARALLGPRADLDQGGVEGSRRAQAVVHPSFDAAAMQALLDGEQSAVRTRVRSLLSQEEFGYPSEISKAEYREKVLGWCHRLADHGFGALSFPADFGGGGDVPAFLAVFETLATHDLSLLVKFGVQFGLFGGSIQHLGTERHHVRYLEAVGRLELAGCFAMTEAGHGSNVRDLETVARYDAEREEFVVDTPCDSAHKEWIGNAAAHGRLATVFAQLEVGGVGYGVHAFLVPIRDDGGRALPGVRIEDCGLKLGLNGVDNGRLWFDHVRVPRENLLDRFAQVSADGTYTSPIPSDGKRFFTMLSTLVGGRVSIASAALSVAKSALTIAIRYGDRRRQFGPESGPETLLLDYLTHRRRLFPRLATTYALDFAIKDLQRRYSDAIEGDDDHARRHVEALAAGLKAIATWHATDTVQQCREACGGLGYRADNRFAALKADCDVFATFEGDNTVLLQLVAKGLLSGFRQQFEGKNFLGLARYLAGRAAITLTELNPIVTRDTDEDHLRSAEFQLGALGWREDHLLSGLARRLKRRIDSGLPSYDAFMACQDHVVSVAKASVERAILARFSAAIEAVEDEGLGGILATLRDLYALSRIEADAGWFLAHGYLESAKAKAIRDLINRICDELRPQALALVAGFGIPDALLAAPIALPLDA